MSYPIELVEWIDHCEIGDDVAAWQRIADLECEPSRVQSIGFVVRETAAAVVIAHSIGHGTDDECCGPMLILKAAIVRRQVIETPSGTHREASP